MIDMSDAMRPRVTFIALAAALCLLAFGVLPASSHQTRAGAPRLVLEGWPSEDEGAIYVAEADGTKLRRVTPFFSGEPAWSPDRRKIAFSGNFESCPPCNLFIYVSAADGTRRRKLARGGSPRWAPSGKRLIYQSPDGIAVINADGSGRRVIPLDVAAESPQWSPDGHSFAFVVRRHEIGYGGAIYVARLDGSDVRRLTRENDDNFDPRWSTDSKKIRFVRSKDFAKWEAFFEVSVDGSHLKRLALVPGLDGGNDVRVATSSWSADGQRVYYCDGSGNVVVLNIRKHVRHAISRLSRRLGCEALDVK